MSIYIYRINGGRERARMAFIALASVCAAVLTSATAAEEDQITGSRSAVVRYADLDLNSEAGARTMYRRLRAAAQKVCEPLNLRTLNPGWHACLDQAMGRAIEQVDKPVLTAYHISRNGKAPARVATAKGTKEQ